MTSRHLRRDAARGGFGTLALTVVLVSGACGPAAPPQPSASAAVTPSPSAGPSTSARTIAPGPTGHAGHSAEPSPTDGGRPSTEPEPSEHAGHSAEPEPTGHAGHSAEPGPTATPAVTVSWIPVPEALAFGPSDVVNEVTAAGPGLVAVGVVEGDAADRAAVWTSADGREWRRSVDPPGAIDATIEDVAAGPDGLVAVGYRFEGDGERPVVWTSTDGLEWRRVEDRDLARGQMTLVSHGPDGWVALGDDVEDPDSGPLAWVSADGTDWRRVPGPIGLGVDLGVFDLIAGGPGYVAVGADFGDDTAAIWTSDDGATWEAVEGLDPPPSSALHSATAGPAGLVAVGAYTERDGPGAAAVWASTDGLAWTRAAGSTPGALGGGEMLGVAALPGGYVAVGALYAGEHHDRGRRAAYWTSADGRTWSPGDEDRSFRLGQMGFVTSTADALVALGNVALDRFGESLRLALWTADPG